MVANLHSADVSSYVEDRHSMPTKRDKQTSTSPGNKDTSQAPEKEKPFYISRYVAVESHLSDRNGSTESVFGLAGERPAGRKLAQDIANVSNQLYSDGYEVLQIIPLASGRAVEATVEAEEPVPGRTYTRERGSASGSSNATGGTVTRALRAPESGQEYYVDTGVGYSVTDGVVILAKLRI
jgi:hypothetical protein